MWDVPEKYVVTFKPGKEMEERVKRLEQEAAARALEEAEAASEPTTPPEPSGMPAPPSPETFGTPQGYGTNPGGAN